MDKTIAEIARTVIIWASLTALGFTLGTALAAITEIPEEIEESRSTYLCVESWKLGLRPEPCAHLRNNTGEDR
jgi:hypothetical protein